MHRGIHRDPRLSSNSPLYCDNIDLFARNLTYQQRQNFALVLVVSRYRRVPALSSAEGDAAAIRAPDRRSQSKNFRDIRRSIERKMGLAEEVNYANWRIKAERGLSSPRPREDLHAASQER